MSGHAKLIDLLIASSPLCYLAAWTLKRILRSTRKMRENDPQRGAISQRLSSSTPSSKSDFIFVVIIFRPSLATTAMLCVPVAGAVVVAVVVPTMA